MEEDLDKATLLIKCIQQRNNTMRQLMEQLAAIQKSYIIHGDVHLQSLTRAEIADTLGVHESTISRAVANKTVQLPNKKIIPMATFFDRSLAVRAILRNIVENENHAMNDTELCASLEERGINVARRTVANIGRWKASCPPIYVNWRNSQPPEYDVSQNLSDFLTDFPFSRSEGIESILTLLNLISDPAVIYDRGQKHILAANNAFYLLTNLEESEFIGKDIHAILPTITDTHPTTGHGQVSRLRHKRQPSIPVEIRLFSLAKTTDVILMLFHPEGLTFEPPVKRSDHRDIVQKFHTLIQSRLQENIKSALVQVWNLQGPAKRGPDLYL